MKALIITESYLPNLGGVEKHIASVLPFLQKKGWEIEIVSKKEILPNQKPKKIFGLLEIWFALARKINSIKKADIIFIHDVFIYYLPFKLIFPKKRIITIFHGWEKIFPIPLKNILYKKLAQFLSFKTISIGAYINKYYKLENKNNYLSYGGVEIPKKEISISNKEKNSFLYIGRLEKDTGIEIFLEFLDILFKEKINFHVKFCGDGPMRSNCQKYGEVLGFVDIKEHLTNSQVCFAGGYLAILEAMAYKNIVLSAYQNEIKKDYLLLSPFAQSIVCNDNSKSLFENYLIIRNQKEIIENNFKLSKEYSFEKLANLYIQISELK